MLPPPPQLSEFPFILLLPKPRTARFQLVWLAADSLKMRTKPSFIMLGLQIYNRVAIGTLTNCSFLFTPSYTPPLPNLFTSPPHLFTHPHPGFVSHPENSRKLAQVFKVPLLSSFLLLRSIIIFLAFFILLSLLVLGRCYFRETVRCAQGLRIAAGGAVAENGLEGLLLRGRCICVRL